jgi:hypothetical protein
VPSVTVTYQQSPPTHHNRWGAEPTSIQQRALTGAQIRMPGGSGVPMAGGLTVAGGAVLCTGSIGETVLERPVTKCCPYMINMLRRLGTPSRA